MDPIQDLYAGFLHPEPRISSHINPSYSPYVSTVLDRSFRLFWDCAWFVEAVKCCCAVRNVPSARRRSRKMAAAITWSANDASTTSVGSASQRGSRTDHHGTPSLSLSAILSVQFYLLHLCRGINLWSTQSRRDVHQI